MLKFNQIFLGDSADILKKLSGGSADLFLTDPPYPREFLHCWDILSEQASRILKPGGYCIAYSGQSYLPDVLYRMGRHLEYRWCNALLHTQPQIVWDRRTFAAWKPILIFRNGNVDETGGNIKHDVIKAGRRDKQYHKWGQDISGYIELLLDYSQEGDLVIDPYVGGGTVPVACYKTNRRFIGIEKDETAYKTACRRLVVEQSQLKLNLGYSRKQTELEQFEFNL